MKKFSFILLSAAFAIFAIVAIKTSNLSEPIAYFFKHNHNKKMTFENGSIDSLVNVIWSADFQDQELGYFTYLDH